MECIPVHDHGTWNQALLSLPRPHVLQSWEWGLFKSRHGWSATPWLFKEADGTVRAATLVLRRQLSRSPYSLLYVPKGPVLDHADAAVWDAVLGHLERLAHDHQAVFVKIDPNVDSADTTITGQLTQRGWRPSTEQIQFQNTMTLDVTRDEETLLAAMKSKWRYNIRLAGRRGVTVRPGTMDDLPLLYDMYRETAVRDDFVIRTLDYYQDAWGSFINGGLAQPLIASVEGDAVAMVILYRFGDRAWYMYGASRDQHREKMPNHLLQWQAMRWARSVGCTVYDLWGAPDEPVESDPMWGVYRFKQGFGATLEQHIGAYDYVSSRLGYWAYTMAMPRLLDLMRRRYWRQVQQ
jgi:lipid II:glycine glycyltransferase (peptidoglycan interpeptide bridge formation enzyme)